METSEYKLQWESEWQTGVVFKSSQRGWMPNGLVLDCHLNTYWTAQPFEYRRNRRHLVFFYTGPVFEWLV